MTRVLRPLKAGEGGYAPLCEMVESTQAEVYEALAYYMDDLMISENIDHFANGAVSGRYLVKLDDKRTVMTNPFRVEHPTESKECLDAYMATHPVEWPKPNHDTNERSLLNSFAGFLVSGMVQLGLARYVPPQKEIASIQKPSDPARDKSFITGSTISWFKLF